MRGAILGFTAGAAALQCCAELPSVRLLAAMCACGVLLLMLRRRWLPVLAGALFGFAWAAWLAVAALGPTLAASDEGRDLILTGTIDSLPFRFEGGVRFNFAVEQAVGAKVPPRVALGWYAARQGPAPEVQPGERWQFTVRLQRPHGNANPDGFDYEVWLLEQGVRATGYVRTERTPLRLAGFVPGFGNLVELCRAGLRERILAALPAHKYAGVIVALVVGDQRAIDQSEWTVFNRTGISHLVSISGLPKSRVIFSFN